MAVPLQTIVETTLTGLGYDLVDLEFGGRGLLRVFIDFTDWKAHEGEYIRIEDCEKATRQLNHVLTVEDIDYARLEVSSPGVDRPLNTAKDFERFAGHLVAVKLKKVFENRRNFEGPLSIEADDKYGVVFEVQRASGPQEHKLTFNLDEVDKVRLVPQISFKQAAKKGTAT